jgi:N6-adenosine-specific RNA methylase IME4
MTKFHTILIDPPWNEQGGGKIKRGADRHYGLLKVEDILDVILGSGTFTPDENCHLYLWVTNNFLADGIWLIEQLGFKYITCITWVKPSFGLGQYFRGQTEQLLFARRGNGMTLRREWAPEETLTTRLDADGPKDERGRRIHSAKPEEAYKLIEKASPPPRLEMFARNRRRGWLVWGNEVA